MNKSRKSYVGPIILLLALACPTAGIADELPITVKARDGGAFIVTNNGRAAVKLKVIVGVEGFYDRSWHPFFTELNLVPSCSAPGTLPNPAPVSLGAGKSIAPPPWRGFSCSGQCQMSCRANVYWGSGPFRFRVDFAGMGPSALSNAFHMPARPDN